MVSNESQINNIVKRYIKLTKQVFENPELYFAMMFLCFVVEYLVTDKLQWPVKYDHCFQRIVLDNICNGCWI